jgi:hypothetical protein
MKTIKLWHESKKDLSKYLQIGDTVDECIADYCINVLPPITMSYRFIQMGEAYNHNAQGKPQFLTLEKIGKYWVYIGIRPKIQSIDYKLPPPNFESFT